MRSWDESTFNEHLGNKTDWGIITGQSLSGKSLVAKIVADSNNGKVVDLVALAESIRPSLASEDGEPFDGRIPDDKVEAAILAMIAADKNAGENFFYLIDGQHHETVDLAAAFLLSNLGTPTNIITCVADAETIEARFKTKNEMEGELDEEAKNSLAEAAAKATEDLARLKHCWNDVINRVKLIEIETGVSKETLTADIRSRFQAKVILVNHEKRIDVDVACSNLAIKYNMLYMSVYQLIRQEIIAETDLGRALMQSKREKDLQFGHVKQVDQFDEKSFSAVHFDQNLVMQLVQQKIAANRTTQRFILLEGFCNSNKL